MSAINLKTINYSVVIGTSLLGFILLSWWMVHDPVHSFTEHVPGADNRPDVSSDINDLVDIGSIYEKFDGSPAPEIMNWPRFRGEYFDNISRDKIKLTNGWDAAGPNILWTINLGEGHAGPVISNGMVYILDYDEEKHQEILRCFSFLDGKEIWRRGYDLEIKRNHGMSRTVPAVSGPYVVTIGPKCQVMCVTADSGKFKWGIDLARDYEVEVPLWYTGQCPLIDDTTAIIAVGGKSLLIAVGCESGRIIWDLPNPNNWKMSHSSIMPMTIENKKMYIYSALGGVLGVSAEGEDVGEVLFESTEWNQTVIAPSPVYLGEGRILFTAGYGAGSMLSKVLKVNGKFTLEVLQKLKPDQGLAAEQQTPIFYNEHVYAIMPKDAGALRNQFVCSNPGDLSNIVWSSGKTKRFGLGPFLVADDKFFILSDEGVLTVIRGSAREYRQIAEAKVLSGHDAWGPLAIADGKLLARDSRQMVCIDVRAY
jgi:outer membrane protein assembly factor BamB